MERFGLENRINWLSDDFRPIKRRVRNKFIGLPPLGYLDFIALMNKARVVLTDSGGAQEESTAMGIPCITLRETTERPVTVTEGTNTTAGSDPVRIRSAFENAVSAKNREKKIPELWDGNTATRILDILLKNS